MFLAGVFCNRRLRQHCAAHRFVLYMYRLAGLAVTVSNLFSRCGIMRMLYVPTYSNTWQANCKTGVEQAELTAGEVW